MMTERSLKVLGKKPFLLDVFIFIKKSFLSEFSSFLSISCLTSFSLKCCLLNIKLLFAYFFFYFLQNVLSKFKNACHIGLILYIYFLFMKIGPLLFIFNLIRLMSTIFDLFSKVFFFVID